MTTVDVSHVKPTITTTTTTTTTVTVVSRAVLYVNYLQSTVFPYIGATTAEKMAGTTSGTVSYTHLTLPTILRV